MIDRNFRVPFSAFRIKDQNFLYAPVVRVFPRGSPPGLVHSDTFSYLQDHEVYVYDAEARDVVKPPPTWVCTMGALLGDIVAYLVDLHKMKYLYEPRGKITSLFKPFIYWKYTDNLRSLKKDLLSPITPKQKHGDSFVVIDLFKPFFGPYFHYRLSSDYSCKDRFRIHFLFRSSHISFLHIHSHLFTTSRVRYEPA